MSPPGRPKGGCRGARRAWVGVLLAGMALSGCAVVRQVDDMLARHEQAGEQLRSRRQAFVQPLPDPQARRAAQEVDRAWLAGRAQPLAREAVLPPALQAHVNTTLLFADELAELPVLAERITRATGIAVRVMPDALLPAEDFLPRVAGAGKLLVLAPTTAGFAQGPQPLPRMLDALAHRLGIHWRYHEGAIEFYRVQTRVFDVRLLTMDASSHVSLGRSGSQQEGGFENVSSTSLSLEQADPLQAVRLRVQALLSRAGTVSAEPGAGASLVVTDTPAALERVAQFLARENRVLTRRVRLVFEEITLALDRSAEGGIDWHLIHQSSRTAAALAGGTAAGLLPEAGRLQAGLLAGPLGGSDAIVAALSQVGTVLRHTRVPVYTLNRRPVTHAVRTTFSYIDQAQTSTTLGMGGALGAALPSVSVSQKQETTGTFLTLLPDAQDDGQVLLSVSYDNTVAQPLKTVTFGAQENQVQIQQLAIDGSGTVQQVALRPGQPMVIAGFDRSEDDGQRRRHLDGWPLLSGGRDRAASQRTTTVVMVGAEIEEGF
ncbi:hypothetical protein V8Z80_07940 [Orrella sp. JC864]|uniref:hypothetical protein n=1 Tax=Orrella sp. JC864 TaxID=3120298 RepID=UPI003008E4D6